MNKLLMAELLRFRAWTLAFAAVHLVALGFLTRIVDLAQQPKFVYQVFGILYAVVGALLGLYQMGSYRRPSHWLNLLHRPLHRLQVAGALCGGGALLLLAAIALPMLLVAGYQEAFTARVVDLRHWLLPLAAWQVACCGYLAGAYAMLADRRHSAAAGLLPMLLLFAQAHGAAALAVQALVLLALAGLVAIAFKPDLSAPPRGLLRTVATALPVQLGAYFLLWTLGYGFELGWTALGTHPLSAPVAPRGGYIELTRADAGQRLLLGLEPSPDPRAPLWREQVALSDAYELYPMRELPVRQQLTGTQQPAEFDDPERPIRWVFSHDAMRFVGHGTLDGRPRGLLGAGEGQAAFPGPALPYANGTAYTPSVFYQYDALRQRLFPRVRLPDGEVFAAPPASTGENVAVMSDRALYFYPGREAGNTLDLLQPLLRVPLPGAVGELASAEFIELLDGYLVSFEFAYGTWSGETLPWQVVVHVGADGTVERVAQRRLQLDLPLAYTMRGWWLSPAMRALSLRAQQLFAAPNPLADHAIAPPPRALVVVAAVLCALSLLAAIVISARQAHPAPRRWAWIAVCGLVGLPALASLWLLYPRREQMDAASAGAALAQGASA